MKLVEAIMFDSINEQDFQWQEKFINWVNWLLAMLSCMYSWQANIMRQNCWVGHHTSKRLAKFDGNALILIVEDNLLVWWYFFQSDNITFSLIVAYLALINFRLDIWNVFLNALDGSIHLTVIGIQLVWHQVIIC